MFICPKVYYNPVVCINVTLEKCDLQEVTSFKLFFTAWQEDKYIFYVLFFFLIL